MPEDENPDVENPDTGTTDPDTGTEENPDTETEPGPEERELPKAEGAYLETQMISISDYYSQYSLDDIYEEQSTDIDSLITTDLNGVFGIPYQFMDTVDRRIADTDLGRKYADKIVSRMPLLFLTPGKQLFMDDFSDNDKDTVAEELLEGPDDDDYSSTLEGNGRYYSFGFDYATYFQYVNTMCWCVAWFMGISDELVRIGGNRYTTLGEFDWSTAVSDSFKSYFGTNSNIVFYLNGLTEVSESFSNSTTESSLASTINGMSDQVKELTFLLGSGNIASALLEISENAVTTIGNALSSVTGAVAGGVISSLSSTGVDSVLQGGKIIFPEIWQDSSYSNSYSFDIKLRSPDNDPVSLYLNILVPYIHLLAFVMPRGNNNDPNSYTSPFLVRAFCKGMFNVDMGIVTSLSVTKGGEQNWNNNGIPSQIDINLEIEDLYSGLFMSSASGFSNIEECTSNTAYMDFLSNMAGLNLAQPELLRMAKLKIYLAEANLKTIPSRTWTRFENAITNRVSKLWNML